jgi:hypothetical protein
MSTPAPDVNQQPHGLVRRMGLLPAPALNMSNMIGVGPFITIPLLMSAMGGPQALLGWIVALVIVLCDGMVWSELGAAMPGSKLSAPLTITANVVTSAPTQSVIVMRAIESMRRYSSAMFRTPTDMAMSSTAGRPSPGQM